MRRRSAWWLLCVAPVFCACSSGADGGGVAGEVAGSAGQSGGVAGAGNAGASGSAGQVSGGAGVGGSAGSAGQGAGVAGQGAGGAGPIGPRFIGRFDHSNPSVPVFAWSGTAIALRFKGTALGVTLGDGGNNWFEVVLDGQHTALSLQAGQKKYVLGTGLSDGPHDVLLYRRSEAFFGETTFHGFDLDPSAFLASDPVPTRRLEVIGDSISAGYGNEGANPCQFTAKTENHYLSYEALAARAVQAELYTEAWSGIGMLRNNGGDTMGTMPERYPRALPERTGSTWDFSTFVPHAVLINLGTNDFVKGDPMPAFQSAYAQFVADLRGHYPAARFYLAVGPMLSGTDYDRAKAYLNGVIAARLAAGDSQLALLEFGTQNPQADGVGCDYHPSLSTHQKLADKLVATLKADLGW